MPSALVVATRAHVLTFKLEDFARDVKDDVELQWGVNPSPGFNNAASQSRDWLIPRSRCETNATDYRADRQNLRLFREHL